MSLEPYSIPARRTCRPCFLFNLARGPTVVVGALVIHAAQEILSGPFSSVSYCDHDYRFRLRKGSGMRNQHLGVLLHTMAISGLSRVTNRT